MSQTVTLEHTFEHQGTTYSSLTMRRPKVRDEKAARKAAKEDAERELRLFANLCEVAPEVIEELDLADYRALQEAFTGFFPEDDDQA